ncbi:hypothetical protein [Streptomyces sp. DB-54]
MSPIAPSLPPHLVQLGFDYVLAVEAGDDTTAARLAPEVEQMPGLLPAIAELVVFPVTALSDDTEPCADSFVLDEVGVLYLMAIREWATHAPAAAAPRIARTIAHFVGQVLADTPADVLRALRMLRDEQVARARAVVEARPWWLCTADRTTAPGGCAPVRCGGAVRWCGVRPSGAHRVHPERTTMRTTVHPVRLHSVGGARTGAVGTREWCALSGLEAVQWGAWRRRVSP